VFYVALRKLVTRGVARDSGARNLESVHA